MDSLSFIHATRRLGTLGLCAWMSSLPLLAQKPGSNPRLALHSVASQGLTAIRSQHSVEQMRTPLASQAQKMTAAEFDATLKQIEKITTMRRKKRLPPVPVDPNAVLRPGPPLDRETLPDKGFQASKSLIQPMASTTITTVTNTSLVAVGPTTNKSQISEPAAAEGVNGRVFYTSNWFAAFSIDGGTSFSYVSPFSYFPRSHGGFCCDQDVIYDPRSGLFLWYLQYISDPDGNIGRLAFTTDPSGTWQYIDIRPDDIPVGTPFVASDWFDYPHLALSNRFVYIGTNVFTASDNWRGAQLIRFDLGELRSLIGGSGSVPLTSISSERIWSSSNTFYTPTQGSTSTVYAFDHTTNTKLRVFAWPENSLQATYTDVSHLSFNSSTYSCPLSAVTNSDACKSMDSRQYVAWVSGGKIGVLWPAAQGTDGLGTFNFPYVRALVIDESSKAVVRDWAAAYATDRAYFFPSGAINANGDLGGTIAWAGESTNPSFGVFIADANVPGSPATFPDFQIGTVTGGDGTQPNTASSERWGDYNRARISTSNPYQWIGTNFNLKAATRPTKASGATDPRYLVWRRDLPATGLPTLVNQPASCTVVSGRTATFGVLAAGPGATPSLAYQWKKGATPIPGATSSLYTTPVTVIGDSGATFSVDVTNGSGTITSSVATLTVVAPTPITFPTQPVSVTAAEGHTATFRVVAAGTGPYTYQWKKTGTIIPSANSSTFTTPALLLSDNGSIYTCEVTGALGMVASNPATLSVLGLGTAATASNTTVTLIPDATSATSPGTPIDIPFTISGVTGTVGEVTFSLWLTHTYVGDLVITLLAPDSTSVILSNNAGSPTASTTGEAFGSTCGSYLVLSDLGATSIDVQKPPPAVVGTFRPSFPLTALNGKAPNGTWTLRIQDTGPADIGSFQCGVLSVRPFLGSSGPSLDLNADGTLDLRDLLFFAKNYGKLPVTVSCDLNSDGTVNDADLTILLAGL